MQTAINYRLQDDIIGRAGRRFDSKHKADEALLEFTSRDASLDESDVMAEKVTRELGARISGKGAGPSKEEEAKTIVADAKMLGPRDIVRASCLGSAGAGASTMSMLSQLLENECE
eukprot:Stramenopile-MAST_4_protein_3521